MTNHPNRAKSKAPCHDLMTTDNARKQIAKAKEIIANNSKLFGGMTVTSTLDNGGKLSRTYVDSQGFSVHGIEEVNGYRRQLVIGQNGYGLHGRYVVNEAINDRTILWVGIAQTTEINDFAEALTKILAERETELAKLNSVL